VALYFGCSRHITRNKKLFSSLTPLSHKEYVTFGDDKKGKVLGTSIIKVNDYFNLNDVYLVDKLRYNMFSVCQLVDADWMFSFTSLVRKFLILLASLFVVFLDSKKIFQANFSFVQSSVKCLISQYSSKI
jgi:hypothetical protein